MQCRRHDLPGYGVDKCGVYYRDYLYVGNPEAFAVLHDMHAPGPHTVPCHTVHVPLGALLICCLHHVCGAGMRCRCSSRRSHSAATAGAKLAGQHMVPSATPCTFHRVRC